MASRVPGFGRRASVEKPVVGGGVASEVYGPAIVDRAIVNEAVEKTLDGADPRHADTMRKLWAMDTDSDLAKAYFIDRVRQMAESRFSQVVKREHVVSEVLTQDEVTKVSEYAREFTLTFRDSVNNEHGFFSARRAIDHQILDSMVPPNTRYLDFGGSVRYHALAGHLNAVTVSPFDIDKKDPTRAALTNLALRKMSVDSHSSENTKKISASVVAREGVYHVAQSVQTACVQAKFSMSVHVYDVPIEEWARMMERCGVLVHYGCVHFDNEFFEADHGVFEYSGAAYEIDHAKDEFRMRVGPSSASWYTHRWSDFMRYGANQILTGETKRYSYQIIERRFDTIFFRILQVSTATAQEYDQFYALPSVPMVEVDGFEVAPQGNVSAKRGLSRKTYLFPHALWQRMLTFATAELDRGPLSYNRLFQYYRTVVPRQSINSVLVSGGQKVPIMDVPALVVMVATVAYGDALLLQRTIRAQTDQVESERLLRDETTLAKGVRALFSGFVAAGLMFVSPLAGLPEGLEKIYTSLVQDTLVTWRPRVSLRRFNAALFVDHKSLKYNAVLPQRIDFTAEDSPDVVQRMVDLSRADSAVAAELVDLCGDSLSPRVLASFAKGKVSENGDAGSSTGGTTVVGTDETKEVGTFTYMRGQSLIRRTVYPQGTQTSQLTERRLAIQEALFEVETESRAVLDTCRRISLQVLVGGKPNEFIMRTRSEEYYNPDLWRVVNGVIVDSVLTPGSEFSHGGVYVVGRADDALQPVIERPYYGVSGVEGSAVERIHYTIGLDYTGYVLVIDSLRIFNGPDIADALAEALAMPADRYDFEVVCHQGPPGCGKTTTIVASANVDADVYLTPTRLARSGLHDRLVQKHSCDSRRLRNVCRTLDSFLIHRHLVDELAWGNRPRLLIDEYVLSRSGKWLAAAVLAGVKEVHAYGDSNQIKHVSRVDVPRLYVDLKPNILEEEFVTHRNPSRVLAAYNYVYGNEIRSTSKVEGVVRRVKTLNEVQWMPNARLVSMYQADKKLLQDWAKRLNCGIIVSTVHEAQGSDCDLLVLYNGETRKRSAEDTFYLYNKPDYDLSGISRVKKVFIYVKESDEPDLVIQMIAKANDIRRVVAAGELETQGKSNLNFH